MVIRDRNKRLNHIEVNMLGAQSERQMLPSNLEMKNMTAEQATDLYLYTVNQPLQSDVREAMRSKENISPKKASRIYHQIMKGEVPC